MKFFKTNKIFLFVLLAALILRLFLANFGTLALDQNTFIAWSDILVKGGLKNFYNGWSDYLPGFLYVLFLLGNIKKILFLPPEILYKIPAILGDLAAGALIFSIVKSHKGVRAALISAVLYLFNIAVFANSSLWGQVDTLTGFFSLLSVWLFTRSTSLRIALPLSAIALAIGTFIKPQGALAAPVIVFLMLRQKTSLKNIVLFCLIGAVIFIAGFAPFNGHDINLISFVLERIGVTVNQYPYTSVNAFNFWAIFGMWQQDVQINQLISGLAYIVIFIFSAFKLRKKEGSEYTLLAISLLTNFLFFTRMHERHLLPALTPLVVAIAFEPWIVVPYLGLSLTYIANLYYSFIWITQNFKNVFGDYAIKLFGLVNVVFLGLISFIAIRSPRFPVFNKNLKELSLTFPENKISTKKLQFVLGGIIAFAFVSRILALPFPANEYFDEVYHAFTAKVMLHGDPRAWEWWNTPPEGFAYEWTHPPLAKELMTVGMIFFGENSFGWRIPSAILGVGVIYLIYLISKKLFKDEFVAVLAAGAAALDGLLLVSSRIGMNDTYFLFFALCSVFLSLRQKNFFSAIFLGLAAACKWSVFWLVPIIVLSQILYTKRFKVSQLWFVILPPLIYVASYIPMFTTGHNWEIFIGMQKQMWWYHTRLVATHPYTSPWYSWPFLLRPIYLYVSESGLSKIYAMGNPIFFWSGIFSIISLSIVTLQTKSRNALFVVFSYLVFFAPWALSPRIMFLYHYLPSLPFMAIAIGVLLRKFPKAILPFFGVGLVLFVYFYPHWAGIQISQTLDNSYYWFSSWR